MEKDKKIAYIKEDLKDYLLKGCRDETDVNVKIKWKQFTVDHACDSLLSGGIPDYESGFLSFKLFAKVLKKPEDKFDCEKIYEWNYDKYLGSEKKKKEFRRPFVSVMRAYIYQAKNLVAMDDTGTSDPYVEIYSPHPLDNNEEGKKNRKTNTQFMTNNPLWYHTCQFIVEYYNLEEAPPIILNVFDTDEGLLDSTDDFMGRAVINI